MEIVEQVIPEPDNFTSANLEEVADRLDRSLKKFICEYMEMDADALVENVPEIPSDVGKERKSEHKMAADFARR